MDLTARDNKELMFDYVFLITDSVLEDKQVSQLQD